MKIEFLWKNSILPPNLPPNYTKLAQIGVILVKCLSKFPKSVILIKIFAECTKKVKF